MITTPSTSPEVITLAAAGYRALAAAGRLLAGFEYPEVAAIDRSSVLLLHQAGFRR
jgi:hypothetical protein